MTNLIVIPVFTLIFLALLIKVVSIFAHHMKMTKIRHDIQLAKLQTQYNDLQNRK